MAYSALVSLTQTAGLILNPLKYSISVAENEQITSIREHAISLTSLLESFPKKSNRLEGRMRDVAAEAEDIIEDYMWNQIHGSSKIGKRTRAEFRQNLVRAREQIGSIVADMMDDELGDAPAASAAISSSSSRLPSTGKNDIVVGLDEELIAIKSRLCGESSKLEYIPILGMGGIGKSTLARCAFDDSLTVEHFYIRAWVTISQEYSAEDILSCLQDYLKMFDDQMLDRENEFTMREKVYKCLKGRRYLIVMDDVWSTKALDEVRNLFPDDDNGSRIILTTRLSDVATYAVSDSLVHELRFMDDDQCWSLLKQKVFANGQGCPSELEDVGKEIARSCRGLPLAVVLIAGVLSKMVETRASWEEILKNLNSIVGEQSEEILSLSYNYLPHYLRACFLYLGGFPEDHEVRASELILLWVAEGFLKRSNESKSMEVEAEEYLEELVERSLVLVGSRKGNGKIKRCTLHDLVRDLCIRKAREEKFLVHATNECADVRRISMTNSNHQYSFGDSTFRMLLWFPHRSCSGPRYLEGAGVKLLRVLEVSERSLWSPSDVFQLFHLRYLVFHHLGSIDYPSHQLVNLHTLIINRKTERFNGASAIQLNIWEMPQLRHLMVYYLGKLPDFQNSTCPLENLKTLLVARASKSFLISLPKMFPKVNKLGLFVLRKDARRGRVDQLHHLKHLSHLEKLKVIFMDFRFLAWNPAFPMTLKKLTLSGGAFPWKDMSIIGSLPILQVLKLINHACSGDTWETTDEEFPQLRSLIIVKSDLRDWITESSHFPRLRCLILHFCLRLREVPDCFSDIPSLQVMEVDHRNKNLVKSAKEILEEQQSQGIEDLQVNLIPGLNESSSIEKRSGKKCHMIGARGLDMEADEVYYWKWKPFPDSRFLEIAQLSHAYSLNISVRINTHILSSNTTYASYLVFKLSASCRGLESVNAVVRFGSGEDAQVTSIQVNLQKLVDGDGAQEQNKTHPVRRDDGWMEVEMGSFYIDDDDDRVVEARMRDSALSRPKIGLLIEGIEFRPKAQFDDLEDDVLGYANSIFFHPFVRPIDSRMCYAVGAKELTIEWGENPLQWKWRACADSRFPEVVELNWICQLDISLTREAHDLFSHSIYAVYLVFKLAERCYGLNSAYASVSYGGGYEETTVVHLQQLEQNGRHPVRRADGWLEVEMGSFYYHHEQANTMVVAKLTGIDGETWKKGLIIKCIEFRPKP